MAIAALAAASGLFAIPALAGSMQPEEVLRTWEKVSLELVRHTATYSPPVASRTFAYLGVTAFEAAAGGNSALKSLAGQLNGLQQVPKRDAGAQYDEALVMDAATSLERGVA